MVVVLMGVSGAGKTTVGRLLAEAIGGEFVEGDLFHPPANIAKMSRGEALDDADRGPWLEAIAAATAIWLAEGRTVVLSCSALKQRYRDILMAGRRDVMLVHLKGPMGLIATRLAARRDHFMPVSLLASQFAALEEPADAIIVDIHPEPEAIVETIRARIRERQVEASEGAGR